MIGVREAELGDCQRAARTLLKHGIVTASRPNDRAFRNVRRFAEPLDAELREVAGYSLQVTRTAVRLVRLVDHLVATPIFHTPSGRAFDPTRYALVVLTLAALERSSSQTTLTDLARRVRRSAERTPGLAFDPDNHPSRLALGHAVRVLEELGALSLTDGSLAGWEKGQDDGEALYDIDRALCRQVFALRRGLRRELDAVFLHEEPTEVGRDPARRARRQRLSRWLLERPVVYFADLDEADQAFLRKEARPLVERLEVLTGAVGERRKEGVALVDPGRTLSMLPFPSGGSAHQAALLMATRLCEGVDTLPVSIGPHAAEASDRHRVQLQQAAPGGEPRPPVPREGSWQPFVDDESLLRHACALRDDLGASVKAAYRDDAGVMLREAVTVLQTYDLVRPVDGGVLLMPALARFREVQVQAPPELREQLGLFGGSP